MRSWPIQNKLLNKLRRRTDTQGLAAPASTAAPLPAAPEVDSPGHRSSEFLEFAQSAGGFGVFELNLVTGIIKGTSLFFELIGLECRDMSLTREEWLASIHPQDLESVMHALSDAVATGGGYETEYRTLTASGEIRWLAGRGQVLLGGEGRDSRAIGTIADITERKELEDKLHYATESLNIAQTAAGVATFDFDFRRNTRICSDNFRELLGIPPATSLDDLNRTLSRVHPDDFARVRSAPLETTPEATLLSLRISCAARQRRRALARRKGQGVARGPGRLSASPAPCRHQRLEAHQGGTGLGGNSLGTGPARHAGRPVGNRSADQRLLVGLRFGEILGYSVEELGSSREQLQTLFIPKIGNALRWRSTIISSIAPSTT